jgi:hypothetical protein
MRLKKEVAPPKKEKVAPPKEAKVVDNSNPLVHFHKGGHQGLPIKHG